MKYFITGATGFVGQYLTKLLIQKGHEVIALVRTPSKVTDLLAFGVKLAQGDVTEKESMRLPMTGVDGVFHVAGWYKLGTKDKSEGIKINIDGNRNVLELMEELKIPKGVYTSTLAVNSDTHGVRVDENYHYSGPHLSEYDRTKAVTHQVALEKIKAGLPLVIVMPGVIYGPGDTSSLRVAILKLLKGQLPALPDTTAYAWAHVEDIAQAHWLAMDQGKLGESYIKVIITNPLGIKLMENQYNNITKRDEITMNLTRFTAGIYYLTIEDKNKKAITQKIIKN